MRLEWVSLGGHYQIFGLANSEKSEATTENSVWQPSRSGQGRPLPKMVNALVHRERVQIT